MISIEQGSGHFLYSNTNTGTFITVIKAKTYRVNRDEGRFPRLLDTTGKRTATYRVTRVTPHNIVKQVSGSINR